jgi:hypothetical protein
MTYGAYALSDSGSGVLWGDFTDTLYYRGYMKFVGTYWEYSVPRLLVPAPNLNVRAQFVNNTTNGVSSDATYLIGTITYWMPKFGDNDVLFIEPRDATCFAASTEVFPPGTFPNQSTLINSYAWWYITMSVLVPQSDFTLGNVSSPSISYNDFLTTLNRMPAVHIFTTFDNGEYYTTGQGLAVYRANGSTAYNSAQSPLQIKDIIDVSMPQDPSPYQFDMNSVNTVNTTHETCSRPMYHFPSLAQAVQEYAIQGSSTVSRYFGLSSSTTTWSYVFWVIYGGGFHKGNTTYITTKWCHQGAGFFGTSSSTGRLFFNLIPNGSSTAGSGSPPFRYNSVNYTGIPVLVADASDYPFS